MRTERKKDQLSVEQQIKLHLKDDEYVLWTSAPGVQYYRHNYAQKTIHRFLLAVVLFGSGWISVYIYSSTGSAFFHASAFALCGVSFMLWLLLTFKAFFPGYSQCEYIITNRSVKVIDLRKAKVIANHSIQNIEKISVNQLGNTASITIEKPHTQLVVTLHNVSSLGKVIQILYEQTGIRPEYVKQKQ